MCRQGVMSLQNALNRQTARVSAPGVAGAASAASACARNRRGLNTAAVRLADSCGASRTFSQPSASFDALHWMACPGSTAGSLATPAADFWAPCAPLVSAQADCLVHPSPPSLAAPPGAAGAGGGSGSAALPRPPSAGLDERPEWWVWVRVGSGGCELRPAHIATPAGCALHPCTRGCACLPGLRAAPRRHMAGDVGLASRTSTGGRRPRPTCFLLRQCGCRPALCVARHRRDCTHASTQAPQRAPYCPSQARFSTKGGTTCA